VRIDGFLKNCQSAVVEIMVPRLARTDILGIACAPPNPDPMAINFRSERCPWRSLTSAGRPAASLPSKARSVLVTGVREVDSEGEGALQNRSSCVLVEHPGAHDLPPMPMTPNPSAKLSGSSDRH
jgi:hypothetical protein